MMNFNSTAWLVSILRVFSLPSVKSGRENWWEKCFSRLIFSPSIKRAIEKVRPFITKHTTKFGTPIPAEECLAITLRYLATGKTYKSLMYQFRIHGPLFLNDSRGL